MRWLSHNDPDRGQTTIGVLAAETVYELPPGQTLLDLVSQDVDLSALGRAVIDQPHHSRPVSEVDLRPPLPTPPSIRDCLGFLDHMRNCRLARGVEAPLPAVWYEIPAFYFANPAAILGPHDDVPLPADCRRFDLELEIAVVIGRGGRDIAFDHAMDHVAGYTLYCDWSARDLQDQERELGIGQGKGKDSAATLGPWLVTRDEVSPYERPDGLDLTVSAHINGEELVSVRPLGMQWSFAEMIAFTSRGTELRPGDVIASGTVPGGCLAEYAGDPDFRGWLRPGDRVAIGGDLLGWTDQRIVPAAPAPAWRAHHNDATRGGLRA